MKGRPRAAPVGLVLPLLVLLSTAGCDVGGSPSDAADTLDAADTAAGETGDAAAAEVSAAVDSMLSASAASWNAGDLEGFLDDYSAGPGLTFVGGSGRIRGIDEVRERYRTSYWAPGAERDSLRFEDIEVRTLGPDHALAVGRYVLHRPGSDAAEEEVGATGWFTLVLEREGERWRIIHDHSS